MASVRDRKEGQPTSIPGVNDRTFEERTTGLPDGYPAYCIYVPSGLDYKFEKNILQQLRNWGQNMGDNLYVAPWEIGDRSYIQLIRQTDVKSKPAIILTDSNNLNKSSFNIVLDSPLLVKDIERLTIVLPCILDLILKGDLSNAAKTATKANDKARLGSLLKLFESKLGKIRVSFSYMGSTTTVESK